MKNAEFLLLERALIARDAERRNAGSGELWLWIVGAYAAMAMLALLPVAGFAALLSAAHARGVPPAGAGALALVSTVLLGFALWGALIGLLQARTVPPQGLDLERHEAPGLFEELDRLCLQMKVAAFDGVLLTTACNAAVTQGPRPGRQGRRRYLILGVPLMQGTSPGELRAVLAHELAHRGDRRWLTRAIERLSLSLAWAQPQHVATYRRPALAILDVPIAWFSPRFHARMLVFRRRQELEADAAAAAICGKDVAQAALARIAVLIPAFQEWAETVTREAAQRQHPPEDLPERSALALASPEPASARHWLQRARRSAPAPGATHPTLTQRWEALDVAPIADPLPPPAVIAWNAWLGDSREPVTRKLAVWWSSSIDEFWQQRRALLHHADALLREPTPPGAAPANERERRAWESPARWMRRGCRVCGESSRSAANSRTSPA